MVLCNNGIICYLLRTLKTWYLMQRQIVYCFQNKVLLTNHVLFNSRIKVNKLSCNFYSDMHFKSIEDVKKSIDDFIESKSPHFSRDGIRQLSVKLTKVTKNNRNYFDN